MSNFVHVFLCAALVALGASGADAQSGKKSQSNTAAVDVSALEVCPRDARGVDGTLTCRCDRGGALGSVWGSGPYTTDSNVCTAATHAGVIGPGGGGLTITIAPGEPSYTGTARNGVETRDWGSYGTSFLVSAVGRAPTPASADLPACTVMPDGTNTHSCLCAADAPGGTVWGSGPFTADSHICTAARFAGYIEGDGGEVHVLRIVGLSSYTGQESFGEVSSDWGAYDSSIVFDWNR